MPILQWPEQALYDCKGLRTIPATSTPVARPTAKKIAKIPRTNTSITRETRKFPPAQGGQRAYSGNCALAWGAVRHARTDTWKVGDVITRFANTGIFLQQLRNILQISVE